MDSGANGIGNHLISVIDRLMICPLAVEWKLVCRAVSKQLGVRSSSGAAGTARYQIYSAKNFNVGVLQAGLGFHSVKSTDYFYEQNRGVRSAVLLGFAGSLVEGVAVGTIVEPTLIKDYLHGDEFPLKPIFPQHLSGILLTDKAVASTPRQKQELRSLTQADFLDMEASHLAKWANNRNVSFRVIRVISDAATDSVPVELADCISDAGNLQAMKLGRLLVFKPTIVPSLLRLASLHQRSSQSLITATQKVMVRWQEETEISKTVPHVP